MFFESVLNRIHTLDRKMTGMRRHQSTIGILAVVLAFAPASDKMHRGMIPYHLETGSQIWINGTATVGSYKCGTVAVYGVGDLDGNRGNQRESDSAKSKNREHARVEVLAKMFDCGNPAMNRDMYAALKANRDSTIQYELARTDMMFDSTSANGPLRLRTAGNLSIAGVTRWDTIIADVRSLPNGKYEIFGRKNLSMRDYRIVPPSKFFGLIKANERLTVGFDLIAAPDNERELRNTTHTME